MKNMAALKTLEGMAAWSLEALLEFMSEFTVDFSYTPEPHIALAPFLSTPFELCALNPFSLFTSFLSKLHFFSCLEHFFVEKV